MRVGYLNDSNLTRTSRSDRFMEKLVASPGLYRGARGAPRDAGTNSSPIRRSLQGNRKPGNLWMAARQSSIHPQGRFKADQWFNPLSPLR